MRTITCKISEKLAAQLEKLARDECRSKSEVVREALENRIKSKRADGTATAYDLVKHLCGSIKGGPSDVAKNPKYMEGFGG